MKKNGYNPIYDGMGETFEIPSYAKVEYHPYRTANYRTCMMYIKRESEAGKELEELLLDMAKSQAEEPDRICKDNHICYSVSTCWGEQPDATKLVIKLSDDSIGIGFGLVRDRW